MTYAEHVAADVALRYGIPVLCDVQIIPRGVSGMDVTLSWHTITKAASIANGGRAKRLAAVEQPIFDRGKGDRITEEQAEMLRSLRAQGLSTGKIAAKTGISRTAVFRLVRSV